MKMHFSSPGGWRRVAECAYEQRLNELTVELQASLAREVALLRDKHDLSQRQAMLTQEFEHRLPQ